MALAILGMPVDKLPPEMVREILKGGAAVCAAAGIPVAGGHSIDCPEPIYGLAVIGTCQPEHVRRNADAQPGDALILTKPLGVGIYSRGDQEGARCRRRATPEMIATTTLLNRSAASWRRTRTCTPSPTSPASACSGHALEMARGSQARRSSSRAARRAAADAAPRRSRRRASSPARRTATGRATATASRCRRTCPTGGATCSPTRRPPAACWSPARPRAPPTSSIRSAKPATPPPRSSAAPSPATLPSSCRTEPAVT